MIVRLIFLSWCVFVNAVDRGNFKTCHESSFCRRQRAVQPGESPYSVLLNTLITTDKAVVATVVNERNLINFVFELHPIKDNIIRIKINEKQPLHQRFEDPYALANEPEVENFEVTDRTAEGFTVKFGESRAVVFAKPLRVDVYHKNHLTVSLNARGMFKFEHYRPKESEPPADGEHMAEEETDKDGLWEETFKSHSDSKPRGPASIGMDISFINSKHVYGIPEHADSFALKETGSGEPYRLYNLDVFEYEVDNAMALYGSIPVMISHSAKHTSAVFWHNSGETWVDVQKLPSTTVVSSITGFFSGSDNEVPQVSTHWMSESGIIDVMVMLGPRPMDVFRQYASLTGTTPLPPLFALAYHQCRWNYNDQEDVRKVHENFDKHDLSLDVMWLDIEHTDGRRYFTWDSHKFPNPIEMTANLTAKGRKLVTIVDPHIKRDNNYWFYKENRDLDFFVKTKDGSEFDGWCWPGSSAYIDMTNAAARDHLANTYSLDKYQGSTLDTFIWNDMNEPSVFNGPEITMQKDIIHPGINVEHREVHNALAMLYHAATFEGLVKRSGGRLRPFVLTRGAYAGSQRSASMWTGDNTAEWSHLRISTPMILSLSVTGITHIGADIGGFFGNPSAELLSRWYQAAAYTPFFRAHAHIDTKRREPWLFDDLTLNIIRDSIKARYQLLPFWYTLFYENEVTGAPPMRPLWVEFPSDEKTFGIDNEFLLGSALLVHPIVDEATTSASVYFPSGSWYDIYDFTRYTGSSTHLIDAPITKLPVFQRGGSILARKNRVRRSSPLMRDDPYTLTVALDSDGRASGSLYIDDEHTYDYKEGKFIYLGLKFEGGVLSSSHIDPEGTYETKSWLERIIIVGLNRQPNKIVLNSSSGAKITLESHFENHPSGKVESGKLVIRKPGVNMREEFSVTLH